MLCSKNSDTQHTHEVRALESVTRARKKYCSVDKTLRFSPIHKSRAPAAAPNQTDDRLRLLICSVLYDMCAPAQYDLAFSCILREADQTPSSKFKVAARILIESNRIQLYANFSNHYV